MKYLSAFRKSTVAGILIGIGCTVYLNMDNAIVGAFLFGLGLFTIINFELNLFTGKIGYLSKDNWLEILVTFIGNAVGINITAFLVRHTRAAGKIMDKVTPIVETKLSDSYLSLFILSIFCGILMFTAVATFKKQPNILGTLAVFLCVAVFILAGFEHCIANMYYFSMVSHLDAYLVPLLIMVAGNAVGGIGLCKLTSDVNL